MHHKNQMIVQPIFPIPQPIYTVKISCFIIMPFDQIFTKLYNDIIRVTVEGMGVDIKRADDFYSVGRIIEDVWNRINNADFIIADLTGKNPNVLYELGIAHVIGKHVILLTQDINDVPFDVRDNRVIVYGLQYDSIDPFKEKLIASINAIVKLGREHIRSGIPMEEPWESTDVVLGESKAGPRRLQYY